MAVPSTPTQAAFELLSIAARGLPDNVCFDLRSKLDVALKMYDKTAMYAVVDELQNSLIRFKKTKKGLHVRKIKIRVRPTAMPTKSAVAWTVLLVLACTTVCVVLQALAMKAMVAPTSAIHSTALGIVGIY